MSRQEPPRDPIADKARALFDRQCEQLDPRTAARLRQARREAVAPLASRPTWLPLGVATVAMLLVGVAWWMPRPYDGGGTQATVDSALTPDIEGDVLANEADSEMYSWLGDAPVAPDEGAL